MRILWKKIFFFLSVLAASTSGDKQITWAGYQWFLRNQNHSGPGPNNWSSDNVWVCNSNHLHLKLRHSPSGWSCAELYTNVKLGFGTYRWFVEGAIDKFDTNVVLGLFTYGGADTTNEIDIEIARWGQPDPRAKNLSYTIYPRALNTTKPVTSGTLMNLNGGTYTTHRFQWTKDYVALQSQGGFKTSPTENVFFSYQTPASFTPFMPVVNAPLHMNLWAFDGKPPTDGKEVEVIIHDFQYTK